MVAGTFRTCTTGTVFNANQADQYPATKKNDYKGAFLWGNSMMASNLCHFTIVTDELEGTRKGKETVASLGGRVENYPTFSRVLPDTIFGSNIAGVESQGVKVFLKNLPVELAPQHQKAFQTGNRHSRPPQPKGA